MARDLSLFKVIGVTPRKDVAHAPTAEPCMEILCFNGLTMWWADTKDVPPSTIAGVKRCKHCHGSVDFKDGNIIHKSYRDEVYCKSSDVFCGEPRMSRLPVGEDVDKKVTQEFDGIYVSLTGQEHPCTIGSPCYYGYGPMRRNEKERSYES